MVGAITVSENIVYPVAAVVSTFWLTGYQTIKVGRARKVAKIPYPQLYAEKAEAAASKDAAVFNCAQRAHQNTLEYLPTIITGTLIAALRHPLVATALCGTWVAFRFLYTIGYSTGDPAKRNMFGSSAIGFTCWIGIMCASTWSVLELLRVL